MRTSRVLQLVVPLRFQAAARRARSFVGLAREGQLLNSAENCGDWLRHVRLPPLMSIKPTIPPDRSTIGWLLHREHPQFVVNTRSVETKPQIHGDVLTAISGGLVALLKEFYGRGPTRAKSYYEDDLVVCVLRGGFSRVEQTLLEGGRGSAVIQQRMEFQELMRKRFEAVIEDATGRRVIGFMSGNQQEPDMMCEVFMLDPSDLVDHHEIPDREPPAAT
jgi:uncharacterized protein YbcI